MVDPIPLAVAVGGPALLVVFFLEGLLVGKVVQPPVVFVGYVTAVDPPAGTLLAVVACCVVTATGGQWLLYRGLRDDGTARTRPIPVVSRLCRVARARVDDRHLARFQRGFDAFGGVAICATNATPGLRVYMAAVAGLGAYPSRRFLLATGLGNCLYFLVLLGAAKGILGLAHLVGGA